MIAMDAWMQSLLTAITTTLALPQFGLSTVFVVAFISATLLPLGSEPAVFGLVKLNPSLFWPAIVVATVGNTLGGMVSWWMGRGAARVVESVAHRGAGASPLATAGAQRDTSTAPTGADTSAHRRAADWLRRFGAKACLLSWLPVVGDPLCAVAGWLHLPFWPCVFYMAIGKFIRYVAMTSALLWFFPNAAAG
jgi:membrane protein YqaA with SNARE-associated domain